MSTQPYTPPDDVTSAWLALCNDTDMYVQVLDRDGNIRYFNEPTALWYRWKHDTEDIGGKHFRDDQTTSPELLEECLSHVRAVCDGAGPLTYEYICHNIRFRLTIRPLPRVDGKGLDALLTTRRMRPWERAEDSPDAKPVRVEHHDPAAFAKLSPRELQVLVLIGEGLTYAEIAQRLHRSVRTVERHRDSIGQKLGARNRVELARFAIRAGLSELPSAAEQHELDKKSFDSLDLSEPARRIAGQRAAPDD